MRCNRVPKHNIEHKHGNQHNFCFGAMANASQCQPLTNKHPVLAALSERG